MSGELSEWDFDIPRDNRFQEWPLQQMRGIKMASETEEKLAAREWLDARYGSTPPVGEWQWTDEIVEAYASSRLARQLENYRSIAIDKTRQIEVLQDDAEEVWNALGMADYDGEDSAAYFINRLNRQNATLRAEVERLTTQLKESHESLQSAANALAGLKGERDALLATFSHYHKAKYDGDTLLRECATCGLDLTDEVHERVKP